MLRHLKVGVYRLVLRPDPAPGLDEVVAAIRRLPPDESRAATLIDDPIRPRDDIRINANYCLVDFNRIRQTDHILTGDIKGNEGMIRFRDADQRPCQRTAVVLDQHSNTMYVQEGWGSAGIGHMTVAKYLKAVANLAGIRVEVVLNDVEALERLRNKKHKAFKVQIAGVQNAGVLRPQGEGDEAIIGTLAAFRAPNANISLSLGPHDDGGLANALETAAALLGWNSLPRIFGKKKPVKYVAVEAEPEPGEEAEPLVNLLNDRMVHKEPVELEAGTEPNDAERYRAVVRAFERFSPSLRERYPVAQPANR